MSVYLLDEEEIWFPPSHEYEFDLVAVGGTLTPERVLKAYSMGTHIDTRQLVVEIVMRSL